ncbi:phosphopantetheine-binding protein [Streptomyces sp. BRA346]|uniref:phosphopantetheine-binding protein n=1 Tax=Streptomyces sp. BRA346 TaxID=2878199 RepID=UPI004063161F
MLTDTTRDLVIRQIQEVLLEDLDDESPVPVTGSEELVGLGLNSLTLTRLVILLSGRFGADPFADESASIADIRTVDQLVAAYEAVRPLEQRV